MTCAAQIQHITGSAFSVVLTSDTSPILEGGEPIADTSGWGIEIVLHKAGAASIALAGSWLDTVAPTWRMLFQAPAATWPAGVYEVGLRYTGPDDRVFSIDTTLFVNVKSWN